MKPRTISRNGTPVGELRPIKRRRFVPRSVVAEAADKAAANGIPLYTRNASDFEALKRIVKVIKRVERRGYRALRRGGKGYDWREGGHATKL